MEKKKVIRIIKSGFTWHVDLHAVADHRAKYYSDDPDSSYKEEYDYVMGDSFEGIDWYQNNMNWEDIPDENKTLVEKPYAESPDDLDDDADVEIVEV